MLTIWCSIDSSQVKDLPKVLVNVRGSPVESKDSIKALGVQIDKELNTSPHWEKEERQLLEEYVSSETCLHKSNPQWWSPLRYFPFFTMRVLSGWCQSLTRSVWERWQIFTLERSVWLFVTKGNGLAVMKSQQWQKGCHLIGVYVSQHVQLQSTYTLTQQHPVQFLQKIEETWHHIFIWWL